MTIARLRSPCCVSQSLQCLFIIHAYCFVLFHQRTLSDMPLHPELWWSPCLPPQCQQLPGSPRLGHKEGDTKKDHRELGDVLHAPCIIWLCSTSWAHPPCTLLCSSLRKESMASTHPAILLSLETLFPSCPEPSGSSLASHIVFLKVVPYVSSHFLCQS